MGHRAEFFAGGPVATNSLSQSKIFRKLQCGAVCCDGPLDVGAIQPLAALTDHPQHGRRLRTGFKRCANSRSVHSQSKRPAALQHGSCLELAASDGHRIVHRDQKLTSVDLHLYESPIREVGLPRHRQVSRLASLITKLEARNNSTDGIMEILQYFIGFLVRSPYANPPDPNVKRDAGQYHQEHQGGDLLAVKLPSRGKRFWSQLGEVDFGDRTPGAVRFAAIDLRGPRQGMTTLAAMLAICILHEPAGRTDSGTGKLR